MYLWDSFQLTSKILFFWPGVGCRCFLCHYTQDTDVFWLKTGVRFIQTFVYKGVWEVILYVWKVMESKLEHSGPRVFGRLGWIWRLDVLTFNFITARMSDGSNTFKQCNRYFWIMFQKESLFVVGNLYS